tara:strand:+ start:16186 stop:16542 length:357 start_codon:yes stop_codon:yes gene_type:complete
MEKEQTSILVMPAVILQQKLFIASNMEEEIRNFIIGYVYCNRWSIGRMSILTEMYSTASKLLRVLEQIEQRGTIVDDDTGDDTYTLTKNEAFIIEICKVSYSTCESSLSELNSNLIMN